jgi:hypothetical protein
LTRSDIWLFNAAGVRKRRPLIVCWNSSDHPDSFHGRLHVEPEIVFKRFAGPAAACYMGEMMRAGE